MELVLDDSSAETPINQAAESKPGSEPISDEVDGAVAPLIDAAASVDVHGQVTDILGQGISDLKVEISAKGSLLRQQDIYSVTTDHRGEFLFVSIPPSDDYRLEVLASGIYLGTLLDPFLVDRDMDAPTIILDSVELVTVDGMIVDVDDAPVGDFEILVQNIGLAYPGRNIVSDSSGFFQLAQFLAGELQLSTSGAEHLKITGITLRPNEYRNLMLVVDKGSYHLSGWVSDEYDAPVAQARVVLTSDFLREDYHSSSYRLEVTDSSGGFSFSGLGGQDHLLTIDAIGYATQHINYRFLSSSDNLEIKLQRMLQ